MILAPGARPWRTGSGGDSTAALSASGQVWAQDLAVQERWERQAEGVGSTDPGAVFGGTYTGAIVWHLRVPSIQESSAPGWCPGHRGQPHLQALHFRGAGNTFRIIAAQRFAARRQQQRRGTQYPAASHAARASRCHRDRNAGRGECRFHCAMVPLCQRRKRQPQAPAGSGPSAPSPHFTGMGWLRVNRFWCRPASRASMAADCVAFACPRGGPPSGPWRLARHSPSPRSRRPRRCRWLRAWWRHRRKECRRPADRLRAISRTPAHLRHGFLDRDDAWHARQTGDRLRQHVHGGTAKVRYRGSLAPARPGRPLRNDGTGLPAMAGCRRGVTSSRPSTPSPE